MEFEEILNRLANITGFKPYKSGKVYLALCPAHEDNLCSLAVRNSNTGRLLMTCFAGCRFVDIYRTLKANVPNPRPKVDFKPVPFWERDIVATYTYTDQYGKPLYQKLRFEPKSFAVRHWNKNRFRWGLGGIEPVLYNLPAVIESDIVFIVEGEKNADAVISTGLVATCNHNGATRWNDSFNEFLEDKFKYYIPDNDTVGLEHMGLVKEKLGGAGEIITLPNLAYKQDVWDWLKLGNTKSDLLKLCK